VLSLTALATFIAWGREPRIVVGFANGQSQQFDVRAIDKIRDTLFRFVAEEANPENRLGVARIENMIVALPEQPLQRAAGQQTGWINRAG
jgi:hypothetical protein